MNPRSEFVKAIIQVLRLEANIYTMGAVEEIIERIKQNDYAMFIAYLGEREGNYEKPIQTIAKGVDEFYEMKVAPMKAAVKNKADEITKNLGGIIEYEVHKSKDEYLKDLLEKDPFISELEEINNLRIKKGAELSEKGYEYIKNFKNPKTEEQLISEHDFLEIDKKIGYRELMKDFHLGYAYNKIIGGLLGEINKPSITQRIKDEAIISASSDLKIESTKVKALVEKSKQVNIYG